MANIRVVQQGMSKSDKWPYTICLIANPWIEAPESQDGYVIDPIVTNESAFDTHVSYTLDSIFGRLSGQAEDFLAGLGTQLRIISVFDENRPRIDANALVSHDNTNIVVPRQDKFAPFLGGIETDALGSLRGDVAFAITASATHDRSSAWFTLDDNSAIGNAFSLDGRQMTHRSQNIMPGTVALHTSATSIVALHEFGHAASSWQNGMVTDLYVDPGDGINKRRGRPIPADFCNYNGTVLPTAADRGGGLPYPQDWNSYHCALTDPAYPAAMDDFWKAAGGRSERCRHDRLTRQFLLDRIQSIMSR